MDLIFSVSLSLANRFGKRYDALAVHAKPASIVTVLEENSSSMDDDLSNGKTRPSLGVHDDL